MCKDESPVQEAAQEEVEIDPLAEAMAKLSELEDQKLRLAAEYDNFRKRSRKEKESLYQFSVCEVVKKLLPILDSLDRGIEASALSEPCENQMAEGLRLVRKQAIESFESLGVEAIDCTGPFDPALHEAISHVTDEELEDNSIQAVALKGYRLGDQVIRHAQVVVAN